MDYHIESMTQDESGIVCEFSYVGRNMRLSWMITMVSLTA